MAGSSSPVDSGRALLPHSLDLEKAVLNAPLEWGKRVHALDPGDFFRDAHVIVAAAVNDAQRHAVVRQLLRERQKLDEVGDVYLSELAKDGVPISDEAIASMVLQLRQLASRRRAAELVLRFMDQIEAIVGENCAGVIRSVAFTTASIPETVH